MQKNEDDEDDDDEGRLQRRKRASGDRLYNGERPPRRLVNLDRNRRLVGIVSLGDLAVETPNENLAGDTLQAVSEPSFSRR